MLYSSRFCGSSDFWRRGSGFDSGISHYDPEALQDHCVLCNTAENLRVERETYTPEAKKILKTSAKSGAKKTGLS